jgi:hypothetical protein
MARQDNSCKSRDEALSLGRREVGRNPSGPPLPVEGRIIPLAVSVFGCNMSTAGESGAQRLPVPANSCFCSFLLLLLLLLTGPASGLRLPSTPAGRV